MGPPSQPTDSSSNKTPDASHHSLLSDIHSLLDNEDLADIILIPQCDDELAKPHDDDEHGEDVGDKSDDGENVSKIIQNNSSSSFTSYDSDDRSTGVPAIKAILAARSPVFRRMLYGEFRETISSNDSSVVHVKLEYSWRVLQLLVEFCFTDQFLSLDGSVGGSSSGGSGGGDVGTEFCTSLEEKARLLTNLSGAAHYFDIPKLEKDISTQLGNMMVEHASLACAILDEASKMLAGETLALMAMDRIRARPKAALLPWMFGSSSGGGGRSSGAASPANGSVDNVGNLFGGIDSTSGSALTAGRGGVIALNASLLEQVIFDEKSTASELTKFHCLQKWVEGYTQEVIVEELPRKQLDSNENEKLSFQPASPSPPSKSPSLVSLSNECNDSPTPTQSRYHQQKLSVAKHLAQKIDLSVIPASDLSSTITESGLLSTHDLYQAYRLQALNAERTKSKVFVEGAGLAEVNGTYIQGGVHEGIPMYNKEGVWRDREEVFRIFLCTYSNGNKSWCISIVPKGKEPGKTTDLDFYECSVSNGKGLGGGGGAFSTGTVENGLGVVPSRGWKLVNYGQPPVPKCTLVAGCLEDA